MSRGLRFHVLLVFLTVIGMPWALAQTDEIQVYDAGIAARGAFSLTLHNNYVAIGAPVAGEPGGVVPEHSLNGVAEWAYGVTDWFEAGLYLPLYSRTARGGLLYNGMKLRALFVTPDAAERRFIYGMNFEFSVNTRHWDPSRYTAEIRPILGWHLGRVDLIFNPILDSAYDGVANLRFAPATRLAYRVDPSWTLALEEYDDFGRLRRFDSHDEQSHQLFGVVDCQLGRMAIEGGVGFGLPGAADHRVLKLILTWDLGAHRTS